ncbi:MAG: hypothetical protein IPI33_14445 [Dehalococcoidia bacterium]|nr:hypothetical protein [Dehalococcoidia bacterium]
MLIRAFFELALVDYLQRSGEYSKICSRLQAKGALPPGGAPTMKQLVEDAQRLAKDQLPKAQADEVVKALKPDRSAPLNVEDLNGFVHNPAAIPTGRDVKQFWLGVEPGLRFSLDGGGRMKEASPFGIPRQGRR